MDAFVRCLRSGLDDAGVPVSTGQLEQMSLFYALLEEANRSFNLTSIEGPEQTAQRHFLDSLALPALNLLYPGDRVIDIGTGAGFPGIPIAIVRPNLHFTLLDSTRKRTAFIEGAVNKLGLANTAVVTARAEDYARGPARGVFSASMSRAVAPINVLLEYALPFLCTGGRALLWKGPSVKDELASSSHACRVLGGGELRLHEYSLADRNAFYIVEVAKILQTPSKYPRKAGIPSKEPII